MATARQALGTFGESKVARLIPCPRCKRTERTIRLLPASFKCADLICDFCGFLAQVKTVSGKDISVLPKTILGAAWKPQRERMEAGIYIPLYVVIKSSDTAFAIYYLPSDFQTLKMFIPRVPLTEVAKRPGWQGFTMDLALAAAPPLRVL